MPRKRRHFYLPSEDGYVTAATLKKLPDDIQMEIMRAWFDGRFDPPDELPHDSGEGGFQWLWGGPYDARHELEQEFGDLASETAIAALASTLEDLNPEWSGKPNDDDFTELWSGLLDDADPYLTLVASLVEIENTAKRKRSKLDALLVHRLLFANIITSLETYLGDRFGKTFASDHVFVETFVFKSKFFQDMPLRVSEIFNRIKTLDDEVKKHIAAHNWHRLTETAKMYKQAFGVVFPETPALIRDGIRDRHDIVHRNGKSPEGIQKSWTVEQILALREATISYATDIEEEMKKVDPADVEF